MALAIVREKELGSIVNLYVTPVTRLEFLLGKQVPYIVVAMINFVVLLLMAMKNEILRRRVRTLEAIAAGAGG